VKLKLIGLLALLYPAMFVVAQTTTAPYGQGTESDPYRIESLENLNWIAANVNGWNNFFESKYLVQVNDIDASATSGYENGAGWKPIGDSAQYHFKGHYDGQGYAISSLSMNRPSRSYAGLFGYVEGGSIRNLGIANANIIGKNCTGALVGYSDGIIEQCYATGSVSGNQYIGGLLGYNVDLLRNSYSECSVTGDSESGGFVGFNDASGRINNCYSVGSASGMQNVGGFIGNNWGSVYNCYSHASVMRIGGAEESFGGFIGYAQKGSIYYCFVTGTVEYENSIAAEAKGFFGARGYGSFSGLFVDTLVSLQVNSRYCTNSSTAKMTDGAIYANANYDFKGRGGDDIWNIGNGRNNGYPYFCWQYPNDPVPVLNVPGKVLTDKLTYQGGTELDVSGTIKDLGSPEATAYGFCWGYSSEPTVYDQKVDLGLVVAKGEFSYTVTGCELSKTIYVRSYIINTVDTLYGYALNVYTYGVPAGSGTEYDPYIIASMADLYWFNRQANEQKETFSGQYLLQTADIDMGEVKRWNKGAGWKPIKTFDGFYDGAGYVLDSLYISSSGKYNIGFFARLNGNLTNLGFTNADVTAGDYSGIVAGRSYGTIVRCFAKGTIEGDSDCGAIVGLFEKGTIFQSYADADVSGGDNVGVFVGSVGQNAKVEECYAFGSVSGTNYVGGFIGDVDGSVNNCYAMAEVTAEEFDRYTRAYGFVGNLASPSMRNCYAKSNVYFPSGNEQYNVGFGNMYHYRETDLRFCFWDTEATNQNDIAYSQALGLSTAEMKDFALFVSSGWDFVGTGKHGVWNIGNGRNGGYPYLAWQFPSDDQSVPAILPAINIAEIDTITPTGIADILVEVTSLGIDKNTDFGLCWSTSDAPTIADNLASKGVADTTGTYLLTVSGLPVGKFIHARAYITNSHGTDYSTTITFCPPVSPAGSGSEIDPYLIGNLQDLYWIAYQTNYAGTSFVGSYFLQTADIDASPTKKWFGGAGWMLIDGISGVYDGGGHVIDGIFIDRPSENNVGFMYNEWNFSLKNLGLTNVDINGNTAVGALAPSFRFCDVINCYATGTVRGKSLVGGFTGENHYSRIEWCYADVDVEGYSMLGGFAGLSFSEKNTYTRNCYSKGSVARIAGNNSDAGGFIGSNSGRFVNDYSIATVHFSGETDPTDKGFNGELGNYYQILECFFDNEATGQTSDAKIAGAPTTAMHQEYFYVGYGWNFTDNGTDTYWVIDANKNGGYPYFSWQKFAETPVVKTKDTTKIAASSVQLNGALTELGLTNPTSHGFCWGEMAIPAVGNSTVVNLGAVSSLGNFSAQISPASSCKTYYARAFATNAAGTAYGGIVEFSLDTEKPTVAWNFDDPVLLVDPVIVKGILPDLTGFLTVSDGCGADSLTITQSPGKGTKHDPGAMFAVTFRVTDKAGNSTSVVVNVSVENVDLTQEFDLRYGWNLVAVTVLADDMSVSSLFPNASVAKLAGEFWRSDVPAYLNAFSDIVANGGYLVYNQADEKLSVKGKPVSPISTTLQKGWNLIGIPAGETMSVLDLPVEVVGVKDIEGFYDKTLLSGSLNTLEAGGAYFIKAASQCEIVW